MEYVSYAKGRGLTPMFKEKSNVEVLIIGKRIIIYDDKANVVDRKKFPTYTWEVKP